MIDGIYELTLNTPMGNIPCIVGLWNEKNGLSGSIELMGAKNYFSGGKTEDNKCIFSGEFNTPMGYINYKILGIIEGDKLNIFAETNRGRFKLEGYRIKKQ